MKQTTRLLVLGSLSLLLSCYSQPEGESLEMKISDDHDPYLWLEEVEGEKALDWVRTQSDRTVKELKQDPRFEQFEKEALEIYEATDRIVYAAIRGDYAYNFWQDDKHIRGIWRRTPLKTYLENKPEWDILLDMDALAEEENENWVYKGVTGLAPDFDRFLIELSRGGKDAVVIREFDIPTRAFVEGGFNTPEAKSTVSWVNQDQVLVSTDFGPGSMTESGYPATIRLWNRGQSMDENEVIASIGLEDVGLWSWTQTTPEGKYALISKAFTFWSHEILLLDETGSPKRIDIPLDADFQGIYRGMALMILRTDWEGFPAGALVAKKLDGEQVEAVFEPDARTSISSVDLNASHILLTIQKDVIDEVRYYRYDETGWVDGTLDLPKSGVIGLYSASSRHEDFFYYYQDLLTPSTLGYFSNVEAAPQILKTDKSRFNTEGLEVIQNFAESHDGTRVPYFLVKHEDIPLDGNNPVLMYGYGGFEVSQKPRYRSTTGKLWLEKGGVFALANIRGGGEYGPAWHQAALKKDRHNSYLDFIAVGEDLIQKKITRPEKLGIMGGSGGGLLVGVVYTMRPDLFGAMVCQVPLLDMLRYHKLLAGASWMGEYGDPEDPEDPEMRAYLKKYSPYHQIKPDVSYAKALFTTSTKDDRVHPGHARKMVARLAEQGHPVMYFENMEGGHAAGANLKQYATMAAIEFTYLHQMLMVD